MKLGDLAYCFITKSWLIRLRNESYSCKKLVRLLDKNIVTPCENESLIPAEIRNYCHQAAPRFMMR